MNSAQVEAATPASVRRGLEINFSTTQCRWLRHSGLQARHPYQRVVRLETSDGIERTDAAFSRYKAKHIVETALPFTDALSQRLIKFFDEYLSERRSEQRLYNCHRFALWMSDVPIPDDPNSDLVSVADQMVGSGKLHGGFLELGRIGVYSHKKRNVPTAVHSVIGLGEADPRCLQVMSINGYLALDTYGHRLVGASEEEGVQLQDCDLGLYVQTDS